MTKCMQKVEQKSLLYYINKVEFLFFCKQHLMVALQFSFLYFSSLYFIQVNLDPSNRSISEFKSWAEFHNGVAAGLRLAPFQVTQDKKSIIQLQQNSEFTGFAVFHLCVVFLQLKVELIIVLILQEKMLRTWIQYNRPSEPNFTHAGLLLAFGLHEHLRVLTMTDAYRYLSQVILLFFFRYLCLMLVFQGYNGGEHSLLIG